MTIQLLFDQLTSFRCNTTSDLFNTPLILMGYLNPVMQYGFEKFCRDAKNCGISGIILPDLPINEFEKEYKKIVEENNLSFIFLITPETSEERIRKIDSLSNGFIYAVSSSSITGKDTNINSQKNYFERITKLNLKNKVLIGFGIRNHQSFHEACKYAAGAIIGTAYINAIAENKNIDAATQNFLNSILNG
jgi:tryptophan synthase alpha chain